MNWDRQGEESIFLQAVQKPTVEAKSAYLDSACGSDVELRQRIERLLAAHLPAKLAEVGDVAQELTQVIAGQAPATAPDRPRPTELPGAAASRPAHRTLGATAPPAARGS
jgi:hypothetical protein